MHDTNTDMANNTPPPTKILYAKKIVLPFSSANGTQSMNMAAAFVRAGAEVSFYPGFRNRQARADRDKELEKIFHNIGLRTGDARGWKVLSAQNKGLYGLSYRLQLISWWLANKNNTAYARDITEGSLLSRLKLLGGARNRFVFEMHEISHDQYQLRHKGPPSEAALKPERLIMRSADGLVLIHQNLVEALREFFNYHGPVLVEPSGYNPDLFFPLPLFSESCPWPGPDDYVELVYTGSLHQGKGVYELIQAMGLLPERFRLRVIGQGNHDYTRKLHELAAALPGGAGRITFTGHLPHRMLREACLGCHISIMPQQEEQGYLSPMKLSESLAMGLPLVTTPLEIFAAQKHLMHMAEDTTPGALAAAINQLAQNQAQARQLREQGFKYVSGLTWQARAERILNFCRQLEQGRTS